MSKPPRHSPAPSGEPIGVTAALLRDWPLPQPDEEGDKEDRGRVLCVGGAPELPGAMVLAGTAALRAGAGKLQIGTCDVVAQAVGIAVPEALAFGLPTTPEGGIDPSAAERIAEYARQAQSTLLGPGMLDREAVSRLVADLLPRLADAEVILVLDAGAILAAGEARDAVRRLAGRVVLTPHAGEMATLLGIEKAEVNADPLAAACRAADEFGATIALKGDETFVVSPERRAYRYDEGTVGLATSGSGDTLAGIIAGLAARGADPLQATCWGVYLHGSAGNRLVERMGRLGFLARELLAEVPALMAGFADGARSSPAREVC